MSSRADTTLELGSGRGRSEKRSIRRGRASQDRAPARSKRLLHAVLPVALCLVANVALAQAPPKPVGEVAYVRNQVIGVPPSGAVTILAVGDDLVLHHRVDTLENAGARLTLGKSGTLSLGAKTSVTIDELLLEKANKGKSRLSLPFGTLRLKLDQLFGEGLEVETPTAVIGVKGTDFLVTASEKATEVTVFEGVVEVLGKVAGAAVLLKAGEKTLVELGKAPLKAAKPPKMPERDPAQASPAGTEGSQTTQPPAQPAGPPRLTGCSPAGQAGEPVCVCGNFPTAAAVKGITLGGRSLEVVSASPKLLQVRLPEELKAGEAVLVGDPKAGFGSSDRCRVGALGIDAEYKDKLKQGRSTYLILTVRGSSEKLRIRLQNLSPDIIRIKGGEDQMLTTSGGRNNSVRVRVKAIGDGRARFRHQLAGLVTCPCAAK